MPALRHLGLRNAEFADDLIERLAASTLLKQLAELETRGEAAWARLTAAARKEAASLIDQLEPALAPATKAATKVAKQARRAAKKVTKRATKAAKKAVGRAKPAAKKPARRRRKKKA